MAIQFDDHKLDLVRRELSRSGVLVKVEPKVFDLLIYLIENRHRVVGKDDLIGKVWGRRVVSDSALTRAINAARNAIGDDGKTQRLIRTSSRKGYRFVGDVRRQPAGVEAIPGQTSEASPPEETALPLPDKPSIAILPFHNIGDDPEQEYFADGMVEDIINSLSRFKALFVIARNSSFTYKGRAVDIKQVGRELGVRYVLEGSVRKAANRLRVTGQLIDATNGAHIWADRFDSALEEVFDLQDRITRTIASALDKTILEAESARAWRKTAGNLAATDFYYRGRAAFRRYNKESVDEAEALFSQATRTDPGFALAYGMACWCQIARKAQGWTNDFAGVAAEARRLAELAWNADNEDASAIGIAGYALAYVAEDLDTGNAWIERALVINPNVAFIWAFGAAVKGYLGCFDEAIEQAQHSIRLSPRDPAIVLPRNVITSSHLYSGRYEEAARQALATLREFPKNVVTLRSATASLALIGDIAQAKAMMARLLEADPTLTQVNLATKVGPHRPQVPKETLSKALRLVGLPEGPASADIVLPDKPSSAAETRR